MCRSFVFIGLLFISGLGFAQQSPSIKVTGRIPGAQDSNVYQMQVGAFRQTVNAQRAFDRLKNVSLDPVYERHLDLTRVMIVGIAARDVPYYIEKIESAGFTEVFIKIDAGNHTVTGLTPNRNAGDSFTVDLTGYKMDPAFPLAYRFNNKSEIKGAGSGSGGIDVLGKGRNNEWMWTTYDQRGWMYDLNGVKHEMVNGYQKDANNGVELTVKPEFVHNNGASYLQLRHVVHNPNNFAVTEQRFGASVDVMIHWNDDASLVHTDYGVYMTDSESDPSLELMFVCASGNGINPVDTLWLGTYNNGAYLYRTYDDNRPDVSNADSAIGFSYQNIDLAPGQTKEFIVRFALKN